MTSIEINLNAAVADAMEHSEADKPVTFVLPLPIEQGKHRYRLRDLREICRRYGDVHFKPTSTGLQASIDRSRSFDRVVALDMIVRDDVAGLERALLSALGYVDEIVISVDGRSGDSTRALAEAYADTVSTFQAADIGLSDEEWLADSIHFANARNFGRAKVQAPWCLYIDSDEIFYCKLNLRDFLRRVEAADPKIEGVRIPIGTFEQSATDAQRLAHTICRFESATHNQLQIGGTTHAEPPPNSVLIYHDPAIRPAAEAERRERQRNAGIELLTKKGLEGNLLALFHAAKHYLGADDERGLALAEQFRLRVDPHGDDGMRAYLAIFATSYFIKRSDIPRAEMWATRALLEGPNLEAFCMLGDLAEADNDPQRARLWYECACAIEPGEGQFKLQDYARVRFERRDHFRGVLFKLRAAEQLASEPGG